MVSATGIFVSNGLSKLHILLLFASDRVHMVLNIWIYGYWFAEINKDYRQKED